MSDRQETIPTEAGKTNLERLKEYEEAGFVFHGSPDENVTTLEPRPAIDTDENNSFNNDNAVFAAPSPAASSLFACMSFDSFPRTGLAGTWSIGSSSEDPRVIAKIPSSWKPYIQNNKGFVYVLPGSTFKAKHRSSWQVKSKTAVVPIDKIEVSFEDFERLGGIISWKQN